MFDFGLCISTKSLFEYYVIYFVGDNYVHVNGKNKERIETKPLINTNLLLENFGLILQAKIWKGVYDLGAFYF